MSEFSHLSDRFVAPDMAAIAAALRAWQDLCLRSRVVSLMKFLLKLCRAAVGALMFFILGIQSEQAFAQTSPNSEVFRTNLQKWVEPDLHFFKDSRGTARLFLRRETVRFALVPSSIPMREELTGLVAELSKATGVAYEETSTDVNLAIVVDSPINIGDKINPAVWKRVGLSDEMYSIVEETGNWASGCGSYSFGNANTGQVGLSIVLVDSKLDVPLMRDCLIDGVLKAFGPRANRKIPLRSEDGYYQFVALARALRRCEQSIGFDRLIALNESEQKSKYAECAADLLSR
jgi:hypothetical protein